MAMCTTNLRYDIPLVNLLQVELQEKTPECVDKSYVSILLEKVVTRVFPNAIHM